MDNSASQEKDWLGRPLDLPRPSSRPFYAIYMSFKSGDYTRKKYSEDTMLRDLMRELDATRLMTGVVVAKLVLVMYRDQNIEIEQLLATTAAEE